MAILDRIPNCPDVDHGEITPYGIIHCMLKINEDKNYHSRDVERIRIAKDVVNNYDLDALNAHPLSSTLRKSYNGYEEEDDA